jgi:hypothetical protein
MDTDFNSRMTLGEKASGTNIQAPEKLQAPRTKPSLRRRIEVWLLEFLWSLGLGIWMFIPRCGIRG